MTRRVRAVVTALLASAALAGAGTAHAWWHDHATATSGTFTAHTVVQPSNPFTCTPAPILPISMTVTAPSSDSRYSYVVRVVNSGGTQLFERPMTFSGGVWTYTLNATDAGLLTIGTFRIRVHARLATAPAWVSVQYRERQFSVFTGLLYGCGTQTV